jgi:hypothetical protein
MPEDRTPHKTSLTEPTGEDEHVELRARRRRQHEAKEANRMSPGTREAPAKGSTVGSFSEDYGDTAPRKLI